MEQRGFYSIVSSYSLRSNSNFKVSITVHKADGPCEIKATIKGLNYENAQTVEVEPMKTKLLDFAIESIQAGEYELQAEGLKGITFKKSIPLHFQENKPLIFIQTDKATYKPKDLIQFRVIFMDDCTRPAKIVKPVNLTISDGEKNRLKHWPNIPLSKGVYKAQYQLSDQPILGSWRIDVTSEGETLETKYFEVDKYVLPKFSVSIEAPKDVAIHDGVVNVTVRAQYTYGKSVKGKAIVSIEPRWYAYDSEDNNKKHAEKTIEVNGRGQAQFKVNEDFCIANNYITTMQIKAIMEEELTGNRMEAVTKVDFHEHRFHFDGVDLPYDFHPGVPLKLKIAVKNLDYTPILNSQQPLKLIIENKPHYLQDDDGNAANNKDKIVAELVESLDDHGIANFEYTFPVDAQRFYYLKCIYLECERHFTTLSKYEKPEQIEEVNEPFAVSVLTKEPKLEEDFEFEVTSTDPIPYFVYTIHARGKHLKTEMVTLPENTRSHIVRLRPTFDMIPYTTIFVHYVEGNDLRYDDTTVSFEREFENSIEITAPTETKPGEDIKLKVKTDPDSYVGLLGVDQSVLLLRNGNDFDKNEVFNALGRFDNATASRSTTARCPGENSGLITLTNALYPVYDVPRICMYSPGFRRSRGGGECEDVECEEECDEDDDDAAAPTQKVVRVRKEFPECWIFDDFENVSADGLVLKKEIPDTITSWFLTGFSLNTKSGIAITKEPSIIKTFRPFFIAINLPYAVKRDEQVTIPALIFNYMDKEVEVEVTLANIHKDFEFVESGSDQTKCMKKLMVSANSGSNVNFIIRPKQIGYIMLELTAICPLAGDAIHKQLKVEPEGVAVFKNRDFYLHSETAVVNVNETVKLDIPANVVPDSEFIEFTVMGNILSSTITNIDNLVRMPCGCGEQIMVFFVPNILILRYLESIQELTTAIEKKAIRFLEIGYQSELTYRHDDGSYSAFGKSDASGSTWLTAYVIRCFHQAKQYIDVDTKILEAGLEFLAKTQTPKGSFAEVGHVLDATHLNEVGLTAFVLLTFLENKEFMSKYKQTLERGFEFLQQNVRNTEDLYGLSIALYTLQQRKLEVIHEILAKLEALARIDGGLKWWTKKEKPERENWYVPNHDVEITGYILMTLLDMNLPVVPITRWLVAQRNDNGGYGSTQNTVVGLWALIKFAEKNGATNPDMSITVKTHDEEITEKTFDINKENSMIIQSLELPKHVREISFTGSGNGTAVLQISYRYNILETPPKPSFKLSTKMKPSAIPARMSLDVLAEYTPEEATTSIKSNMVVMEVSLPSGYTALSESFDKIKKVQDVKCVETKNSDTSIVIYFDNLQISDVKCIPIVAELTHEVAGQKPAPIVIYDYYDNDKHATAFYELESDLMQQ